MPQFTFLQRKACYLHRDAPPQKIIVIPSGILLRFTFLIYLGMVWNLRHLDGHVISI